MTMNIDLQLDVRSDALTIYKCDLKMYDVIILSHERGFKGHFSSLICSKTRKKMRDPEKGAIFDKIKRETLYISR